MTTNNYEKANLQHITSALDTINALPQDYKGETIYLGGWCSQEAICLDIAFFISRILGSNQQIVSC